MTSDAPSGGRRVSMLGMTLSCALVGLLCGLYVSHDAMGRGWQWFPVYTSVAAALTGGLLWWLLVVRPDNYAPERCVCVGALSGIAAHYVCWYMMIVSYWLCAVLWGGCLGSLGDRAMNPLQAVLGAGAFSLGSLYLFGWVTVPAGAILGAIFGTLHDVRRR